LNGLVVVTVALEAAQLDQLVALVARDHPRVTVLGSGAPAPRIGLLLLRVLDIAAPGLQAELMLLERLFRRIV
jgi:hypothetical protein